VGDYLALDARSVGLLPTLLKPDCVTALTRRLAILGMLALKSNSNPVCWLKKFFSNDEEAVKTA
jgi:hypothetical protein